MTFPQACDVRATIQYRAHDILVLGKTGDWFVAAIDDTTGCLFEVHDYEEWKEKLREAQLLADYDSRG